MGRQGYGQVGGRRSGSAAWQWIIIGITMGFGCSAIILLTLLTAGIVNLSDSDPEPTVAAAQPTEESQVIEEPTADIQATVEAAIAATQAAQPPTPTVEMEIAPPTPTPTQEPALPPTDDEELDEPPAAEQDDPADLLPDVDEPDVDEQDAPDAPDDPQDTLTGAQASAAESSVPPELEAIRSEVIQIPGGTFLMGTTPQEVSIAVRECVEIDEGLCQASYGEDSTPAHSVTLDTYFMEVTEVTNQQYVAFLNSTGPNSHNNGCFNNRCVLTRNQDEGSPIIFDSQNYDIPPIAANLPVIGVTWYGARAYCEAIGRRLPTEAEWERAARGDQGFVYPWGNERDLTLARTSRPRDGNVGPVAVGSFAAGASPYGILDMAGNVAEWVFDWYQPNYYAQPDASGLNPTGPVAGTDRVIRGGSWDALPFFSRTVHRQHEPPGDAYLWLGFRCAADFEEEDEAAPESDAGSLSGADLDVDLDDDTEFEEQTPPEIDAAPTLPPVSLPSTQIPAVPPGG